MDQAEEAVERFHQARLDYFRRQVLELVHPDELVGTAWDPTLPAFLRRQAD